MNKTLRRNLEHALLSQHNITVRASLDRTSSVSIAFYDTPRSGESNAARKPIKHAAVGCWNFVRVPGVGWFCHSPSGSLWGWASSCMSGSSKLIQRKLGESFWDSVQQADASLHSFLSLFFMIPSKSEVFWSVGHSSVFLVHWKWLSDHPKVHRTWGLSRLQTVDHTCYYLQWQKVAFIVIKSRIRNFTYRCVRWVFRQLTKVSCLSS